MKQVYQAHDGSIHNSKSSCADREELLDRVDEVRKMLPNPEDVDCKFANGGGYYQLTDEEICNYRIALRTLLKEVHPDLIEIYDKCPVGIIGRYLCDSDSPIRILQATLCQIDEGNRLWGQQYYANNPSEGKQINLRKETP